MYNIIIGHLVKEDVTLICEEKKNTAITIDF